VTVVVWICLLAHCGGWNTHEWLCGPDIAARLAERDELGRRRWAKVEKLRVIDGGCADCVRREQAAPGYVTPTPDYSLAATQPAARSGSARFGGRGVRQINQQTRPGESR
jgi:hypothetical protein